MTKVRRTRFVCVSDTHNGSPLNGSFKLPKGDVLVHAGDMTNQGTYSELSKTIDWIERADFEVKIVVAGNHDITLDETFYTQYGAYFHNQHPESPTKCMDLIRNSPSITYLNHESTDISLRQADGPHTTFRVFGSPMSPANGLWAFGYPPEQALGLWEQIPLHTDVLITHTPPKYHCDESRTGASTGCEYLRQALWRARPRLAICGHVHEARGVERVRWDLSATNVRYKEDDTGYWVDPGVGNKKQSLVDLSSKGGEALDNSGAGEEVLAGMFSYGTLPHPDASRRKEKSWCFSNCKKIRAEETVSLPVLPVQQAEDDGDEKPPTSPALSEEASVPTSQSSRLAPSRGLGGEPPSGRCDLEALTGRLGRRETCIINAATMARIWPHKAGGKQYNKPIVVDIDLPVSTQIEL